MPFTVSHAVVALPFIRSPLPAGAVAVGAMAPDLPLFFPAVASYHVTHGFPGAFLVTLPLALVLLVIWRMLLRPVIRELSPRPIGQRLPSDWSETAGQAWFDLWGGRTASARRRAVTVALLLAALMVGVLTHLFFDAFTHEGRLGVELFPVLAESWGGLEWHRWAQRTSSVAFGAILLVWAVRWLAGRTPAPIQPALPGWLPWAWWASVPLSLAAWSLVNVLGGVSEDDRGFVFRTGTAAGASILLVTAVVAVVAQLWLRRNSDGSAARDPGHARGA